MALRRLQGTEERQAGVYYEYDTDSAPLGEGAMGRVFKGFYVVEATGERKPVAVKCIFEGIPERVIERARREASVRTNHENLLRMFAFIEMASTAVVGSVTTVTKNYFLVMELLEGVTLHDFLKGTVTNADGTTYPALEELHTRMEKEKAAVVKDIMIGILDGLQALHNAGFLHRDLDPSNIMMTSDGGLKIIDFGICKPQNALNTQDKGLTVSGVFMGKPDYASPELATGDVVHQNQTTDIYAVGVILFQLCTGHVPFSGANNDILLAHMREPLPVNEIEFKPYRKIVAKATEKVQGKRYPTAMAFKADIEKLKFVSEEGLHQKFSYKTKLFAVLSAVVLVAIVIFGLTWGIGKDKQSTETAVTAINEEKAKDVATEDTDALTSDTVEQQNDSLIDTNDIIETISDKYLASDIQTTKSNYVKPEKVNAKTDQSTNKQEEAVVHVYYIIGTKKELQDKGLLTKSNLFKKTTANLDNLNNAMFVKGNMQTLRRIKIPAPAKKVKVMTKNPESAYSIEIVDKENSVLIIHHPKTFWAGSKYLIIRI